MAAAASRWTRPTGHPEAGERVPEPVESPPPVDPADGDPEPAEVDTSEE